MRTSDSTAKIAEALAIAQGKLSDPPAKGRNPHYKSRFARLQDGLPSIRRELSAVGVSFLQGVDIERSAVVTRLSHKSGEWIEADYPLQKNTDPQKQGSALTYARRYGLFALLGLAADEDDDGNAASAKKKAAPKHDPSFKAHRAVFCATLGKMGLKYEAVADACEANGWGRPSGWSTDGREKLLSDLDSDQALRASMGGES
jgi:hypothetical protein